MCLYLSVYQGKTRQVFNTSWHRELQEKKKIVCYKVLKANPIGIGLISPFLNFIYRPGWNESSRVEKDLSHWEKKTWFPETKSFLPQVNVGIHVYRTKRAAKVFVVGNLIVPVTCYLKDLVAMGKSSEAVFMQVFLKKEDYDKAIFCGN